MKHIGEEYVGVCPRLAGLPSGLRRPSPQAGRAGDADRLAVGAGFKPAHARLARLNPGLRSVKRVVDSCIRRVARDRDFKGAIIEAPLMAELKIGDYTLVRADIWRCGRGRIQEPPNRPAVRKPAIGDIGELFAEHDMIEERRHLYRTVQSPHPRRSIRSSRAVLHPQHHCRARR